MLAKFRCPVCEKSASYPIPSEEELVKQSVGSPICDGKDSEGGEGTYKSQAHQKTIMERV